MLLTYLLTYLLDFLAARDSLYSIATNTIVQKLVMVCSHVFVLILPSGGTT